MKKILLIFIVVAVIFFFPKKYVISPGYTTEEFANNFQLTKKSCLGFVKIRPNTKPCPSCSEIADLPKENICFGWLK